MKSLDNSCLAAARVIRQGTIFSIIERLGTDYSFDQQKTALSCLLELPEDPQILSVLVQESTFEQIIKFLRVNDDAVKTNCFKLLLNIMSRIFEKAPTNEFKVFEMGMLS